MKIIQKLKKTTIDNIITLIISFIIMLGSGYILPSIESQILRCIVFLIFFISFGVSGYNITVLLNCKYLGKGFIIQEKDDSKENKS